MFWPWQKLLSINDLEPQLINIKIDTPQIDIRSKIKTLIIDDKKFTPKENLHQIGYNIVHVEEINHIQDVLDYDLILVDLKGVGMKLDPVNQGAFLIKEIKTNYPDKIVIAYTGGAMDELMAMAVNHSDHYLQKDSSIEEWCNLLDGAIKTLADPIDVWKNARKRLLDCGVSPKELTEIEHYYVLCFSGNEIELGTLINKTNKMKMNSDARAILTGIGSNAAFSLIKMSFGIP